MSGILYWNRNCPGCGRRVPQSMLYVPTGIAWHDVWADTMFWQERYTGKYPNTEIRRPILRLYIDTSTSKRSHPSEAECFTHVRQIDHVLRTRRYSMYVQGRHTLPAQLSEPKTLTVAASGHWKDAYLLTAVVNMYR